MAHTLNDGRPIIGMDVDSEDRSAGGGHDALGHALPYVVSRFSKNIQTAINRANKGKSLVNVLGTLQITKYTLPYSGGNIYPQGTNRCIGAHGDSNDNTVIFFVWNSNGNHQILRYYRDHTDPVNPFGEVQQVIMFNFGWTRRTRITSIELVYGVPTPPATPNSEATISDLLYWSDPVPRKINLTKANICNRSKSYVLYAPNTWNSFANAGTFGFVLQDINLQFIVNASIPYTPFTNNNDALQYLATQLNNNYGNVIHAEACDCSLTITETGSSSFYYAVSGVELLLYPVDWYGSTLFDRFFDRCKWMPMNAPQPLYEQDPKFAFNFVQNRLFQFRLEYDYDDLEPSCLGVWSQIAINNMQCDGTANPLYNNINVNFNDIDLTNPYTLIILKKIRFVVREQNSGTDKLVQILEPCDFLDFDGTNWFCHFKFYNDINATVIDANKRAQLYDAVPLTSGAELFTKNLVVEGDIKTGYNAPECPSATVKVFIGDTPQEKIYKITFKVRVLSYPLSTGPLPGFSFGQIYPGFSQTPFWQDADPNVNFTLQRGIIGHDTTRTTNDFAYFGGGGFSGNSAAQFGIRAGMEDVYDQRLPEGGWPVYFAGTPFFGVSKQVNVGLPTDGVGALDTSTSANRLAIGNLLVGPAGGGPVIDDLYSEVTIYAPAGDFIARVGSHWSSYGDKLGKGFAYDLNGTEWRNTSTNVWGIFSPGSGTIPQYTVGAFKNTKEIKITVTGDNDDAGTFLIMDLAPPFFGSSGDVLQNWIPLNAYLYDSNNGTTIDSDPNEPQFNGASVEKAVVDTFYDLNSGQQGLHTLTDHNGYFFCFNQSYFFGALQVNNILLVNNSILWQGGLTDLLNKTMVSHDFGAGGTIFDQKLYFGVLTTTNLAGRQSCSTFIKGRVIDQNGNALPNAIVVYENGRVVVTDITGGYDILAWGDMVTPTFTGTDRTVDSLIFAASALCSVTYPNGQVLGPILLTPINANASIPPPFVPPYSPTQYFVAADFIINELLGAVAKALKRGGSYVIGAHDYDSPGRPNSVYKLLDLYIPFETEDLSKFDYVVDASGNPYTTPTYLGGIPTITITLGSFAVLREGAFYQIMLTQNGIQRPNYLQWAANSVQYLSKVASGAAPDIQTSYNNGNATAIKISLANIVEYKRLNQNSQIGYTPVIPGDRLRFLYDQSLSLIKGVYDLEITGYDAATQSVYVKSQQLPFEVKPGFQFEIYNPETIATTDTQLFFEMGQVFKYTHPGQANNTRSTTVITLTCGDTYWIGRFIPVEDPVTGFNISIPAKVESGSLSDFFVSNSTDIGRVGIIDPAFVQLEQPTTMVSSGVFLPDTATNGLSTFDTNLESTAVIDKKYGRIMRLFFEQNNLIAICSSKEVSNYIERQTLYEASSSGGVISATGDFFGTQYIHLQNLGTDFKASCYTNSGKIYGWTNARSNVWAYQQDGEQVISDNKFITWFKQLTEDGVTDAIAVYNRYSEEYILTYWRKKKITAPITVLQKFTPTNFIMSLSVFNAGGLPLVGDIIDVQYLSNGVYVSGEATVISVTDHGGGLFIVTVSVNGLKAPGSTNVQVVMTYGVPETISWFEGTSSMRARGESQYWSTFYDFTPECYAALGTEIFGFVNGEIWIHDKNPVRNNFYGVQYGTTVTPVFNEQPMDMKVWNALWMKMQQDNRGCDWFSDNVTNIYGQLSRLKAAGFSKIENGFYIDFKRDLTDTVAPPPTIINGREMRSEALTVALQNNYSGEITLYAMRANYTLSERTSK